MKKVYLLKCRHVIDVCCFHKKLTGITHTHTQRYTHGHVPLPVHEQVHVLDASVVGVVQAFGQVLLQVRLEVLIGHLTLKQERSKVT